MLESSERGRSVQFVGGRQFRRENRVRHWISVEGGNGVHESAWQGEERREAWDEEEGVEG